MTPEEQALCDRLDACDKRFSGDAPHEAAALIRRLAAALAEAAIHVEGLSTGPAYKLFCERHADALRDVKEQA